MWKQCLKVVTRPRNDLSDLLRNNRRWASSMLQNDPQFFKRLEQVQSPKYLWIGCSDSRVPANTIIGKLPGEVFVHRNVANCVVHSDPNCQSVLQFAVDILKVRHVIVCGHYNCGGVHAALNKTPMGSLVDSWIRNVRDVYSKCSDKINSVPENQRLDLLCEEHTRQQTRNVCHSSVIQNAWERGQFLVVHGLIYNLKDGRLQRLLAPIKSSDDPTLSTAFRLLKK
jgi:carbonic anhydrase